MVETINNFEFFNPRFKPWAIKKILPNNRFNGFHDFINAWPFLVLSYSSQKNKLTHIEFQHTIIEGILLLL